MYDPLMFEAGRIASQRAWTTPTIIPLEQISGLSPTGPPLIAIGKVCDVELSTVQALAALAGASRDVVLITDKPLTRELAEWLPATAHHVLGDTLDLDDDFDAAPSGMGARAQETSLTATAGGPYLYCKFADADSLAPLRSAQSGWVLEAWKKFVRQHSLSLADQGRGDQVSAGCFRFGDDQVAPLWFLPMHGTYDDAEFVLIGSTIAVVDNPETQVAVSGSEWQNQFADQVVSWCEQPEAAAMLSRAMGQFAAQTVPLGQRKTADECFTLPADDGARPDRVLITDGSDQMLVWTSPTVSDLIPIGTGGRALTFIYRVPAYRDFQILDAALSHAIGSLVRIHELLGNPESTLDGRRDSRLADQLKGFVQRSGLIAHGALARMQNASKNAQYAGPLSADGLSRISAILAEAVEAQGDNSDPGWQSLFAFGDIGFPAAVKHHKYGTWPSPQEREAIKEVYLVLCDSLGLDPQHEWADYSEIVDASIAAQQQLPSAHEPVMPQGISERICDKCGSPAEAGDKFCGTCGSAL